MTKLEEEIHIQMLAVYHEQDVSLEASAKAAAEVAKKYIEMAFSAGESHQIGKFFNADPTLNPPKEKWLKDNGITE